MIFDKRCCGRLLFLTGGAEAEKFNLMGSDLVASGFGHLGRQLVQQADVGIDDAVTAGADQVRVGIGFVAVVMAAAVGKTDLKDLANFFKQRDGFVDRSQAGGRKLRSDLIVDLLDARVLVGMEKNLQNGETLRGNPTVPLSEFFENVVQSLLRLIHGGTRGTGEEEDQLKTDTESSRMCRDLSIGGWFRSAAPGLSLRRKQIKRGRRDLGLSSRSHQHFR